MIRPARRADFSVLQEIERAAGFAFADIGMRAVADDDPPSLDELLRYQSVGRAWVNTDDRDVPVAYLIADVVDGCAHIEQVSVHPDHAGQKLGRQLIEYVADWARKAGLSTLTLTTFTEVPWNGPYYRKLGFRYLDDRELSPGLREIRRTETMRGLDRWPRACMRRDL
ncbi:GNAT family N-acetyltransferase [Hoyosella altamirensis]|uniref:GNAT superfamily N-acetyltransferase n=1 Tax=Hoyosella altamirensis TaxID=616997 RepID=A0A839RPQ0_9ACTN|nr:GNAT family N-acetyltransferase [Hoyosella altamirensis]MBB3038188.1 GNAT superfamily N-acetyltransferase [Hoyosella altamirensis]